MALPQPALSPILPPAGRRAWDDLPSSPWVFGPTGRAGVLNFSFLFCKMGDNDTCWIRQQTENARTAPLSVQ